MEDGTVTRNNSGSSDTEQDQRDADADADLAQEYEARKPKWWTKLSGRRGTRAQRRTIERMTHCGYCFSKEVLSNFSRINHSARHNGGITEHHLTEESDTSAADRWRRIWWNRSLAVLDEEEDAAEVKPVADTVTNSRNQKHKEKIDLMYNNKSPLVPRCYEEIWLEIGFGNGDNIIANAKRDPDILFIGSEIHQPGIGTVLRQMELELDIGAAEEEEKKVDNPTISRTTNDNEQDLSKRPCKNIRILPCDGIKLLSHLPCQYLDKILITFPDPWPKIGHSHWRVIQKDSLMEMHRVLKDNGLVFVATDSDVFYEWTRNIFEQESSNGVWEEVCPCPDRTNWLPIVSYYEQKGIDEGRAAMLQCWKKT